MRKAVAIIAALAAGVWAFTARADTWTDPATGLTWTYTVSGGKASVGGGSSSSPAVPQTTSGTLAIPSTINGYPVTSIGNYAFWNCYNLTSVTMSDSVTSIGNWSFGYCRPRLTSVTIGSGVTSIGGWAFYDCSGLTSVTIGSGVTSIGESAFNGCSNWNETVINVLDVAAWCANSVNGSFRGNRRLLVGGEEVFNLQIPGGVTNIGDLAFFGCSALTSVAIPDSVTSIGSAAFYNCSGLTSVTIPDSVTSIGNSAFYNCSGLTSVTIPGSVTSFGPGPFSDCLLIFDGEPPSEIWNVVGDCALSYPAQYEALWRPWIPPFAQPIVKIVTSEIRANDPTILDTRFKVLKSGPMGMSQTVKIRALAFEDGERSFAKVVRPETFVDGTAPANWDAVEANVEHTLSWKVSSDWATRLAKVKFEILASDGDLLPLELRTIPASDQYGKMKISWNAITESQVFDALLWQYADKDPGLTLAGGVLSNGSTQLASGSRLSSIGASGSGSRFTYPAPEYIYSKMGYQLLTGAPLSYANSETRLRLSPAGVRQYAYKIVEE